MRHVSFWINPSKRNREIIKERITEEDAIQKKNWSKGRKSWMRFCGLVDWQTGRSLFEVSPLSRGNGGISGPPGKENGVRDGKDGCPMFRVSEKGRVTHANSLCLLLLFPVACVCAGCHYTGLHLSFSLTGRTKVRHAFRNTNIPLYNINIY